MGQILIALRRSDRLEDVVPYIETIGERQTKIVLLVHYAGRGVDKYLESLSCVKDADANFLFRKDVAEMAKKPPTEEMGEEISITRAALSRVAAQTEVTVYAGTFRKALSEYMRKQGAQVSVLAVPPGGWLGRIWKGIFLRRPLDLPGLPPLVLYFRRSA